MSTTLSAAARTRLVKLLGLLGSNHAGERDAAGLAAQRLLTQHGATWRQILEPPVHREPLFSTWRVTCEKLLLRKDDLRPWEKTFVADLPNFRRISTKQRYILSEIASRVLQEHAP